MNEQLPPIDSNLRRQLARRIAGRPPEGLTEEVSVALDAAAEPRVSARWTRPAWTTPRLAGASAAAALVAIIVAAVVLPAAHSGPTTAPGGGAPGYPADRALTTAELAAVMIGPALATNTTLVAAVTIQSHLDVCPMNRYPTVGVIEGMSSQVCVMGATVDSYTTATYTPGVFAFRYLAPGYLGLIGEITPASSSHLAFRVSQDWPPLGKTFLVDGYLGAVDSGEPCVAITQDPGDLLMPNGSDLCGHDNWLGDDPTAPGIAADHAAPSGAPSYDPASLRGNARHVEAGGVRQIDAISYANPVRGVFVVQAVFGGCPGDPAWSNRGCNTWLVMARVSGVSVPEPGASASVGTPASPSASPADFPAPSAIGLIGPGNRPIAEADLETMWAADPTHLANETVVVNGPLPTGFTCPGIDPGAAPPPGCPYTVLPGQVAGDGYWAVRVASNGRLTVMGEVAAGQSGFVFDLGSVIDPPAGTVGRLFIVDAWLDWAQEDDNPKPPESVCHIAVLTTQRLDWAHLKQTFPSDKTGLWIQGCDAYQVFGSQDAALGAVHGLYLFDSRTGNILARIEPAVIP